MIDNVKIGPLVYKVKEIYDLRTPDGDDLYGAVKFAESEILIEEKMGPQRQRVTALHEIIHAMFDQCGIPEIEEHITAFSFSMYGLLKDNPELVAWIQDAP